jgi:hypothetical protein
MCLGNGPSSEDESLRGMRHDALFRVNHSWKQRGFLSEPDVVFTGGRTTLRALDDVVFGVVTAYAERIIVMQRLSQLRGGPARFFNVSKINPRLDTFDWATFRPTNGVTMIAAAVALQPEKLIVGGIDLFQHPAGVYPGDTKTPNSYTPAHSPARELQFILEMFDTYQGDLVIVGEILRERWAAFCRSKPSGN